MAPGDDGADGLGAAGGGSGATPVNYGVLSKEPCQIYGGHLHFRGITMRGVWMSQWLKLSAPAEVQALYAELAQLMNDGVLHMAVAGRYSFDQIKDAAAHAAGEARGGKVLISPA